MTSPPCTEVHLWTDGSGTTAALPGGWAFVALALGPGGDELARAEGFGSVSIGGSNNRMELSAVIHGLRSLRRPCRVKVFTDSEYVAKAFPNGWLEKWDRDGWEGVKNEDLWRALRLEVHRHQAVAWVHVDGHSGLPFNERADELAGKARKAAVELLEAATASRSAAA